MGFHVDQVQFVEDWRAIRMICARTGAPGGKEVEEARRDFFAELWVGPYEKLSPERTYVLRDPGPHPKDLIGGYLVAADQTRDFERRRLVSCELPLVGRLAGQLLSRRAPLTVDGAKFLRRFFRLEPRVSELFSRAVWRLIHDRYPAHLHMNVLEPYRRKGYGTKLVDRLCRDLKTSDILGVHCVCGEVPKPFYLELGFEILEEIVVGGRVRLFAMGKRIA